MLEGEFIRILYIYKRNKIKKFERILYLKLTSVKKKTTYHIYPLRVVTI
jgi:hypothetical protein